MTDVYNDSNKDRVDSVCDFINNNDVFNLLELPGLKLKGSMSKNNNQKIKCHEKVDLLNGKALGQTVKIILLKLQNCQMSTWEPTVVWC